MAFTDHSDMFAAVHESGINATISQLMLQRPSMFNYATILFTQARLPITVAMPGRGASPTARRGRPWSGPATTASTRRQRTSWPASRSSSSSSPRPLPRRTRAVWALEPGRGSGPGQRAGAAGRTP